MNNKQYPLDGLISELRQCADLIRAGSGDPLARIDAIADLIESCGPYDTDGDPVVWWHEVSAPELFEGGTAMLVDDSAGGAVGYVSADFAKDICNAYLLYKRTALIGGVE